jgi:hypothetical protein
MTNEHTISRRRFLRAAFLGGSGLFAASIAGCDDNGGSPSSGTSDVTVVPSTSGASTTPVPTQSTPRWERMPNGGLLPPPRHDHSLVTDGQRLYLYGGRDSGPRGDLWAFNLEEGTWTEIAAPGPPARFGHNAAYDAATGRMLVFGGQAGGFFNDVWAYVPSTGSWRQVIAGGTGPTARYGAASAPDPSGRFFVSHGFTDSGRFDDTWTFGGPMGEAWSDVSPATGRPIERCLTRGVWDLNTGRFLMFGGQTDSAPFLGDTWQWVDAGWSEIVADNTPSARNLYSMVFDGERGRALLCGGRAEDGPKNDVWVFESAANAWLPLVTSGEAPSPRSGHDAVWLPGRRAMLLFGGEDASGELSDLWELRVGG